MKKLYVIGNGFDIQHHLPTSYSHFRDYLAQNDYVLLQQFESLYLLSECEMLWKQLQYYIGNPNFDFIMGLGQSIEQSIHLESGPIDIQDMLDDYWDDRLITIARQIRRQFDLWIRTIKITQMSRHSSQIIEGDNIYLSFNYTKTLETVYDIQKVTHIHGCCDQEELTFGHGNVAAIEQYKKEAYEACQQFHQGKASICRAIHRYLTSVLKDTKEVLQTNHLFFESLHNIDEIITIGWSIGDVDYPYLSKIAESIGGHVKWTIYYHTQDDLKAAKDAIKLLNKEMNIQYVQDCRFWDLAANPS